MEQDKFGQNPSSSSGNAATSNTLVYQENEESPPEPFPHRNWEHSGGFPRDHGFWETHFLRTENGEPAGVRGDNCSSLFVFFTFLFSVSMTLIWDVYGSTSMRVGPNSSILLKSNPIFVEYVKVEELDVGDGPMLFGFYGSPLLDVATTWSEIHKTTLRSGTHKNWIHFLNEGSEIDISYEVSPPSSSSLVLVIAQGAYYKCTPAHSQCVFDLQFPSGNVALVTSPGRKSGMANGVWLIKLSYGPRLITYVVSMGGIIVLVLLVRRVLNHLQCARQDQGGDQYGAVRSERNPLLLHKDGDLSSMGSSCDTVSQDDEFPGEGLKGSEGKPVKNAEHSNGPIHLCAICYDAPKDSFFLPCGHCVACFACATRILETVHTCPICRRHSKKVRKIYTV